MKQYWLQFGRALELRSIAMKGHPPGFYSRFGYCTTISTNVQRTKVWDGEELAKRTVRKNGPCKMGH